MSHRPGANPPQSTGHNIVEQAPGFQAGECESILVVGVEAIFHASLSHLFVPGVRQGLVGASPKRRSRRVSEKAVEGARLVAGGQTPGFCR